jgi:hypothetical protein
VSTTGRRAAVFTIVQNEPVFLPIWDRYYRRHFDADDMFVLDHDSTDPATLAVAGSVHRIPVHRSASFDHTWLKTTVVRFQQLLLQSYDLVLFTEVDEIVAADPAHFAGGLRDYVAAFPGDLEYRRCQGWEVIQQPGERPIDWNAPLLDQRDHGAPSRPYSKPLLSRIPLDWHNGFHGAVGVPPSPETVDHRLLLLHLHRVDFGYCLERHRAAAARTWSESDVAIGAGYQNRIVDEEALRAWFHTEDTMGGRLTVHPLPGHWRKVTI